MFELMCQWPHDYEQLNELIPVIEIIKNQWAEYSIEFNSKFNDLLTAPRKSPCWAGLAPGDRFIWSLSSSKSHEMSIGEKTKIFFLDFLQFKFL